MAKDNQGGKRARSTAAKPLTDEQKEALEYYVEDGYYINTLLRNGDNLDESDRVLIKLLDEATNSTVKQDVLYRVVDANTIFEGITDFVYDDLRSHILLGDSAYDRGAYSQGIKARMEKMVQNAIGKVHTDKGFMSTSFSEETAQEKYGSEAHGRNHIVLRITNAKGSKGRDISGLFNRDYDAENEVLLKRNNSYEVKRVYGKDYTVYVDVELKK